MRQNKLAGNNEQKPWVGVLLVGGVGACGLALGALINDAVIAMALQILLAVRVAFTTRAAVVAVTVFAA